jgi:hypothetical protein
VKESALVVAHIHALGLGPHSGPVSWSYPCGFGYVCGLEAEWHLWAFFVFFFFIIFFFFLVTNSHSGPSCNMAAKPGA